MTGITDLTALSGAEVPDWLARVGLPATWRAGRYTGSDPTQPWRIAVRGSRPDGGWDACESITVFGFTGSPATQDVWDYCERTLRELKAEDVVVIEMDAPTHAGLFAVSGAGRFRVGGRDMRGQHNFFVAGTPLAGQGRLVQQCLYVDLAQAATFESDLALLGDNMHRAFVNSKAL